MNIIPANQIKCEISRNDIINQMCENLMKSIQERAANGKHDTCFHSYAHFYKEKVSGKIYTSRPNGSKYEDYEYITFPFCDYEDEIRKKFRAAGYTIKPTGYIGGVWQQTEDICW